jgi:hypothetical protein
MSTRFSEFQLLRAAHAVSRDRFCVAVHKLDVDDPFSIILEYDGNFTQPWSRVEVRRNVADVTAKPDPELGSRPYIAISDEGDVFSITGDGILTEKIRGAGVYSADADGSGGISGISFADGKLYAFGLGGQLYVQDAQGTWRRLAIDDPAAAVRGSLKSLGGNEDIYIVGSIAPQPFLASEEIEKAQLEAAAAGDFQRFEELSKEAERVAGQQGLGGMPTGLLLHGSGESWRRLESGAAHTFNDVFIETSERVWICGTEGSILLGNGKDGFKDVSFHGDRSINLVSLTKFRDRITLASDYGLHSFDGHILSTIKPKLDPFINRSVPTPFKVQAVDDVMFYFDYKHGVHRFDGENWEEITIPPELLARDFQGLRRE